MVVDPPGGNPDPGDRDEREEAAEQPGEEAEDRQAALRERVCGGRGVTMIGRGGEGHGLTPGGLGAMAGTYQAWMP